MKKTMSMLLCALLSTLMLCACGAKPQEEPFPAVTQQPTEAPSPTEDPSQTGTSQNNAILIPLGSKIFGQVKSETNLWYAFTTHETSGATYCLTVVNENPATGDTLAVNTLEVTLLDETGDTIDVEQARKDGAPYTIYTDKLSPNTTYYVRLHPSWQEDVNFSLVVKDPDRQPTAYQTANVFTDARGAVVKENETITTGTNVNGAVLIPLDTKVYGNLAKGSCAWLGFTTSETEGVTYTVSFTNDTPETAENVSYCLTGYVYDEYGKTIDVANAYGDGTPDTLTLNQLAPNTTYYLCCLSSYEKDLKYSVVIKSSETAQPQNTLVFEKPFEINETQVRFVINQATFIDENAAKEALKPVAEAVLAYPDHSILIAGTTATDGTQASCEDLATRRAEAVKNLLINTYHVPASQLQIVGLGYEKDPFERGRDRDSNGKFVESEGKKNRRVVILDINDPIAQEILKNQ